jgi:hypothetical protein
VASNVCDDCLLVTALLVLLPVLLLVLLLTSLPGAGGMDSGGLLTVRLLLLLLLPTAGCSLGRGGNAGDTRISKSGNVPPDPLHRACSC